MKALDGAFNQEKALVGAFSMIVKTGCGTDGALHSTSYHKLRKLKGLTLKDTWELGDVLVRATGAGEGLQNATFNHTYK